MSPPNSRWSSLVFFSELLHLSLAYLFPSFSKKKTSSRNFHSFLFDFCSAYFCIKFLANLSANSLQIFVRSYLTSGLRWQVFFSVMNLVSPNCHFRSNRISSVLPKHATRCHRFQNRKNSLPLILCFFWSSSTQWILSSNKHHIFIIALCCDSRIKPIHIKFQRERERLHLYQALLGNWCQRGRERSHQSFSFRERSHLIGGERSFRGRERSPGWEDT